MTSKELRTKVKKLCSQVDDLRYKYHVLNDPSVTDKMYEGLMDELRQLEKAHPELITPDSPTQRVAGEPAKKFEKVKHTVPQWSFNDAFNDQDLLDWEERILKIIEKQLGHRPKDISYVCELKIDGLHMVLTYRQGALVTAATRGNGKVGEDVTQNIRTIHSVPLKLKEAVSLIVEGEAWMSGGMLEKINKERKRKGEPLYANPRNVAAGTIRQLDAKIVAARKLQLTAYDISGGKVPESQEAELKELGKLGFLTDMNWKVCKTVSDITKFYHAWEKKKDSQDFWVDGVVVKVNQKKYQDMLGFTGKAPRWALALKFAAEQGTTKIKEVYWQVGRTGALTPVALMDPVQLAGTTVTHATLHNYDEIERLGVRVGDSVVVEKAGDIIPKVVRVLEKMRSGQEKKLSAPSKCPLCGGGVGRRQGEKEDSVALYCLNKNCFAQELARIRHFVSKKAFDIDHLGAKIVEQLIGEGLIKDAADLFILTAGDLEPLERFADKSAQNLVKAIADKKNISLPRFINALGITHVGEETGEDLAAGFGSLEKLAKAPVEELSTVEGVGAKVAESIVGFFSAKENQEFVKKLQKNGVKIGVQKIEKKKQGKLVGKTFVLTGTLQSMSRDQAKAKIISLGGDVSSSVSKNTFAVVTGTEPGSKLQKAEKLGVKVLAENEFIHLIKKVV